MVFSESSISVVSRRTRTEDESNHYVSLRDINCDTILKSLDKQCDEDRIIFPGFVAMKRTGSGFSVESTIDTSEFGAKSNKTRMGTKLTPQILLGLDRGSSSTRLEYFHQNISALRLQHDNHVNYDGVDDDGMNLSIYSDTTEKIKKNEYCMELSSQIHPLDDPGRFRRKIRRPSLDSTSAFIDGDTASRSCTF